MTDYCMILMGRRIQVPSDYNSKLYFQRMNYKRYCYNSLNMAGGMASNLCIGEKHQSSLRSDKNNLVTVLKKFMKVILCRLSKLLSLYRLNRGLCSFNTVNLYHYQRQKSDKHKNFADFQMVRKGHKSSMSIGQNKLGKCDCICSISCQQLISNIQKSNLCIRRWYFNLSNREYIHYYKELYTMTNPSIQVLCCRH